MALVLVPPQRQGVLSHVPQIWFGFENCRCHTCTQWGRKVSLLNAPRLSGRAVWARKQVRKWGEGAGKGARLGFYCGLGRDCGEASPHGLGLACCTFLQAPREGAPGLSYQRGQMWKSGEEGLGSGQAVGSRTSNCHRAKLCFSVKSHFSGRYTTQDEALTGLPHVASLSFTPPFSRSLQGLARDPPSTET